MIVRRTRHWEGPVDNMDLVYRVSIQDLSFKETAVIVSALEEYGLTHSSDDETVNIVDDLVMQITRVTGY